MMRALIAALFAFVFAILGGTIGSAPVAAADGVVRAVLFYSPTCPHCHQVINTDLPPLQERFGERFQLVLIDISNANGARLYDATTVAFGIPDDRLGVPTVVIGETVLVGSREIPQLLPGMVEYGLSHGGVDWPAIPGLQVVLATPSPTGTAAPGTPSPAPSRASTAPTEQATTPAIGGDFDRDPLGNGIALAVLTGLLVTLGIAATYLFRARRQALWARPSGWIAPIGLIGLVVAAYLASVELSGGTAVCGPVGDCNAVHASVYARVLGIPVGVLGVLGYLAVLSAWIMSQYGRTTTARMGNIGLILLAVGGTLFSAYLTFLEPFVIGATCGWCLLSAVAMGVILALVSRGGRSPSDPRPPARKRLASLLRPQHGARHREADQPLVDR